MITGFKGPDVNSVTSKSREVFRRSRNSYMQAIAEPESAFDAPLFPTHSSHLCCHERAGWGRQNWVWPRAWETLGTPLVGPLLFPLAPPRSALPPVFHSRIITGDETPCVVPKWWTLLQMFLVMFSLVC